MKKATRVFLNIDLGFSIAGIVAYVVLFILSFFFKNSLDTKVIGIIAAVIILYCIVCIVMISYAKRSLDNGAKDSQLVWGILFIIFVDRVTGVLLIVYSRQRRYVNYFSYNTHSLNQNDKERLYASYTKMFNDGVLSKDEYDKKVKSLGYLEEDNAKEK